jgi:hypothetical protein
MPPLPFLMVLCRLSHPRTIDGDMFLIFDVVGGRMNRFIFAMMRWLHDKWSYTLKFDKERLRRMIPTYANNSHANGFERGTPAAVSLLGFC